MIIANYDNLLDLIYKVVDFLSVLCCHGKNEKEVYVVAECSTPPD